MTLTPTLSRRWNRRISRSSRRSTQASRLTSSTSEGSRVWWQASPVSVARASAAVLGRSPSSASIESSVASTAWRAYLEGYAAAAAWTDAGEAFHISALHSSLQTSFLQGFEARRAEDAQGTTTTTTSSDLNSRRDR